MKLNNLRKNKLINLIAAFTFFILQSNLVYAQAVLDLATLPQNLACVAGCVDFSATTVGNTLTVRTTGVGIATADSHDIGSGAGVNYFLNGTWMTKITNGNPTTIAGNLHVEGGSLFLQNGSGVLFTGSSRVDAPGLLVSTLDINNADFLAGNYKFFQNGAPAYIVNEGQINIINGGYAMLLSNAISNVGSIAATLGKIILASGEKMTVGLDDANDIAVTIDDAVKNKVFGPDGQLMKGAIKNSGTISAEGGKVLLTAKTLNNIFDYAVNNAGVIEAKSLVNRNGSIELLGDGGSVIAVAGSVLSTKAKETNAVGGRVILKSSKNAIVYSGATIDVSGGLISGDAGFIEISGNQRVGLYSTQLYTNAAVNYRRGFILIDPQDIIIQASLVGVTAPGDNLDGVADIGYAGSPNAVTDIAVSVTALQSLNASEVYLQATRNIFIADDLDLTLSNSSLKLEAGNNIEVNANITTNGKSITLSAGLDPNSVAGAVSMAVGKVINSNGGAITINSDTAMTLRDINAGAGIITLNPFSGGVTQAAGALTAASLALTGAGTFILTAANNDVNTLGANVNGAVTFTDVDDLIIGTAGSATGIISTNNNITLNTGNTLTLAKTVNAGTGVVTLNPTAGGVNQTDRSISASSLLLTGAGAFNLSLNTFVNSVGTLAANINGALTFKNNITAITIGTVGGVNGINTNGNNVVLNGSGRITIAQDINVGAASIILNPSTSGIIQTGGAITAANLLLTGAGSDTLNSANNDVDVLASSSIGTLSFTDIDGLTVGTIGSTNGISQASNVSLTTGGLLTLTKNISSGGSITLNSAGITQGTGIILGGGKLLLLGTGAFVLTNASNDIGTLAANITGGALSYTDTNALTIGTVGSTNGVTTANNNFTLIGGALTISQALNVGTATATLNAAGATQNAAITADKLGLSGTGTFTLTNVLNDVATLAASTNGAVSYKDANSLTVGVVGSLAGLTTTNNTITLATDDLTISNVISSGTANTQITQATNGRVIDLGTNTVGTLGLTDLELDNITSAQLIVGDSNSGAITVSDNVNPANSAVLNLISGAGIEGTSGKTLSVGALTASAVTGIGVTNVMNTASAALNLASTNGNLRVNNSNASTTTASNISTGSGNIAFNQSGGGALAVSSATTSSGAIDLSNTGANLTAATVTAGGALKNVTLTTTGSGNILVGNVTAVGDSITVSAAGSLEESGSDVGVDLTANALALSAASGIGALGTIETAATSLTSTTTSSNIDISNANASATTVSVLSAAAGNVSFNQLGGGDITLGALTALGSATLSSTASILDDATQSTKITADTVNLTAATAIGGTGNNDIDTDVAFINANAGNNIYLNENNGVQLTTLTSTNGLASLSAAGAVTLKSAITKNDFTLSTTIGDVIFDGTVESTAGAVNVQVDNGSIKAVGNVTHLKANADSLLSVLKGSITPTGQELNVNLAGDLTVAIGGEGAISGKINGTINSPTAAPLVSPSVPPLGIILFNGQQFGKSVSAISVAQASNVLINRFSFPAADQIAGSQVVAFNPPGPSLLYHPLTELDSGAFDQEFQLDEGAYDYIDGRIEQKERKKKEASSSNLTT